MNNSTEILHINHVIITWFNEAPQSVNISRFGHLQNAYYFGPMSHNTIWQNSVSKVDYIGDNKLTLFRMDVHIDFVEPLE
jgi:hypothetical protein